MCFDVDDLCFFGGTRMDYSPADMNHSLQNEDKDSYIIPIANFYLCG